MKKESFLLIWPNTVIANTEIDIIAKILDHRNAIILKLLDDKQLSDYLFFHFRIRTLSRRQTEQIRKILMSMLISQLDLNHYCRLIKKLNNDANSMFTDEDELYFHYEIESLIEQYLS